MPPGLYLSDLEQVIGMSPQGTRFLHKGVSRTNKDALRGGMTLDKADLWLSHQTNDSAQISWPRQAPDVHQLATCLYQFRYLGAFQID